ncbi:hypothetical protein TIFTF001_017503 [Ficus carica]|uniref:ELMO domain-containing protein n=1 Tax=Ficus carica TaxID=3494 RepID=A0AA88DAT3_FICCA|nr:hypothetical protein TIFTF001_017503 [Ficus carica]
MLVGCIAAEVVAGSAAWLGRGLSCVCAQRRENDARPSFDLTPSQEECLQRLQNRIDVAYDSSIPEHREALMALWNAAYPEEELRGLISEQWKEMGWQGKDPSTDFRCGTEGDRSVWEYPFAVAGVNITFMLIQMLDLEADNESAFDLLYCITFKLMDHQWLTMRASYMDFNTVMKSTRRQLEKELLHEDVTRLEDLPSYSLLSQ